LPLVASRTPGSPSCSESAWPGDESSRPGILAFSHRTGGLGCKGLIILSSAIHGASGYKPDHSPLWMCRLHDPLKVGVTVH
jgi:hypothetical protein